MEILSQQALRGRNYWSQEQTKLIQSRLQLSPTHELGLLQEKALLAFIQQYFPTFDLPHIIGRDEKLLTYTAMLALSLQQAAACPVKYWQFHTTAYPGIYNLLVAYSYEEAGKSAVECAFELIIGLQQGQIVNFESAILEVQKLVAQEKPSPKMAAIMQEAETYAVPFFPGEAAGTLQLGYGVKGVQLDENTALAELQLALKAGQIGRIPLLAVTGSNGKTTTTRLLAHIIEKSGKKVGFTTSDGIYIDQKMVDEGDTTGPISAQMVLADQRVEVAVLETARGGIVRAGLGFDYCDLAIVTNVQEDHLGISDIETLDQLACVKAVIVQALQPQGWAILNANNAYTVAMGENARSKVAWFAQSGQNAKLLEALAQGAPVAYVVDNHLVVQQGKHQWRITSLQNVPISFAGSLGFMVENALAATLAAWCYGIAPEVIAKGLATFYPSPAQTPGRMNFYPLRGSQLLVDFAHNPDGFAGIRDYLATIKAPLKIGIIVGTGDRKDEDTRELGRISAQMFDVVLIHQLKFLRGRTADELVAMLVEGMHVHNPNTRWQHIPDEVEPLAFALSLAVPGSYIVALSDVLSDVGELVARYGAQQ